MKTHRVFNTRDEMYRAFPPNGIGAEIGVAFGGNAASLFNGARPKELHLIDCWEPQIGEFEVDHNNAVDHGARYKATVSKFGKIPSVHIHKRYSVEAAMSFEKEYFDWIYIDANHMSVGFLEDLNAWYSRVKIGGIISGHDYLMEKPNIQVKDVLNRWMQEKQEYISYLSRDRYPSWCIIKGWVNE